VTQSTGRTRIAGILVGGHARRMGGIAKGLLQPAVGGPTIVERTHTLLRDAGLDVVLLGEAGAYESLAMPAVGDDPLGHGPIGGLRALLRHAGGGDVLLTACDMPHLTAALIERLLSADARTVAPRVDGRWIATCARYGAECLAVIDSRLARGWRSLHGVLDAAGAVELALAADDMRALRDWDTPEDVRADAERGT